VTKANTSSLGSVQSKLPRASSILPSTVTFAT